MRRPTKADELVMLRIGSQQHQGSKVSPVRHVQGAASLKSARAPTVSPPMFCMGCGVA